MTEDADTPVRQFVDPMDTLPAKEGKTSLQKFIDEMDLLTKTEDTLAWRRERENRIVLNKPIIVLTARHRWFLSWCDENDLNPRDRRLIRVSSAWDLGRMWGIGDFQVVWLDDWIDIPRYDEVYAYIQHRMATGTATERTDP